MEFNKKLNRLESKTDHKYPSIEHGPTPYFAGMKAKKGKLKCRLIHTEGNSIILPDFIFYDNGWIQPLNFTAPLISKLTEKETIVDFYIGIQNGLTIKVRFYNTGYLKTYDDRSQLYECEIYSLCDLKEYLSGAYEEIDGLIHLKLYHHTNQAGYDGISESKSLWASAWNYRGNKKCENFNFVYFTHIPEIKFKDDLNTVAMSADGDMHFMVDSFVPPMLFQPEDIEKYKDYIYTAKVYRATTNDRNKALEFLVPVDSIDAKHIYRHEQNMVFYEVCFSYIHRIKVEPESVLSFDETQRINNSDAIVNGEYLIVGDATNKEGLAAPFEEEETEYIFKMEDCGEATIPDFWISNPNQDHFSAKKIESLKITKSKKNPASDINDSDMT